MVKARTCVGSWGGSLETFVHQYLSHHMVTSTECCGLSLGTHTKGHQLCLEKSQETLHRRFLSWAQEEEYKGIGVAT